MKTVDWAAICIGAVAMILPAWLVASQPRTPQLRHSQIQAFADAGCKCARLRGDVPGVDRCWKKFETATGLRVAQAGHTLCYPLTQRGFWPDEGGESITLNYDIAGGPRFAFCGKSEAMAAEALWTRIAMSTTPDPTSPAGQQAGERAYAALLDYARRLARNERVEATQSIGCVGGFPDGH